jgi:hypothetical protein
MAVRYTEENNKLWDSFITVITREDVLKKIKEDDLEKKDWQEKKKS